MYVPPSDPIFRRLATGADEIGLHDAVSAGIVCRDLPAVVDRYVHEVAGVPHDAVTENEAVNGAAGGLRPSATVPASFMPSASDSVPPSVPRF